jgi:hypothetical protein
MLSSEVVDLMMMMRRRSLYAFFRGCRFDDDEEEELWTTVRVAALPGDPSRPHRRRRTGPAFTCRAMACASACRGATARTPGFLASRYSRSATAKRPLSEMPSSAAYRRPRCANSSGSRNVMAIGESLSCGITMISWRVGTRRPSRGPATLEVVVRTDGVFGCLLQQ